VVSFTARPLYPQGKSSLYPLGRRLGGPGRRSGRGGEEKNFQPPPGIENPDRPLRSPALYRLSCHGCKQGNVISKFLSLISLLSAKEELHVFSFTVVLGEKVHRNMVFDEV
jgi:hypothetical protein